MSDDLFKTIKLSDRLEIVRLAIDEDDEESAIEYVFSLFPDVTRDEAGTSGQQPDRSSSWWSEIAWIDCGDGKQRPTQPGLQPLAHGIPNRVGLLRGAGNAIVPQVGAAFVEAYLAATD